MEALEGLGALAWSRGRLEESARLLRRVLAEYQGLGHDEGVSRASGNLATVLRDLGRFEEAAAAARRCRDMARRHGFRGQERVCTEVLAQALALTGR